MERPIGFWLKLVDTLITEQFAATLEEHGVTRLQWQLLNLLSEGPVTGPELTRRLAPFLNAATGSDEPTDPAEHLGELLDAGWVEVDADTYTLTERGSASHVRLLQVVESLRSKVGDGVAAADYATTIATLRRMAGNLGWTENA